MPSARRPTLPLEQLVSDGGGQHHRVGQDPFDQPRQRLVASAAADGGERGVVALAGGRRCRRRRPRGAARRRAARASTNSAAPRRKTAGWAAAQCAIVSVPMSPTTPPSCSTACAPHSTSATLAITRATAHGSIIRTGTPASSSAAAAVAAAAGGALGDDQREVRALRRAQQNCGDARAAAVRQRAALAAAAAARGDALQQRRDERLPCRDPLGSARRVRQVARAALARASEGRLRQPSVTSSRNAMVESCR